jgi:osmoprotectant transport system permease protein
MRRLAMLVLGWTAFLFLNPALADATLRVGSKRFTESYILGEILTRTAAAAAAIGATHRQGLGNTAIVLAALRSGDIDVYPEYLGTIDLEILKNPRPTTIDQMRAALQPLGLGVAVPLGFSNGYALAMRGDGGSASGSSGGIKRLSELARQPQLHIGLSHEFLGRADGWPGLARRYGLPQTPRGLDHGIAYEALMRRQIDVTDIYSTDAKIRQYGLRVLDDDLGYFPRYDAVLLYRLDLPQRFPAAWRAMERLEGRISADAMIAMNAAAELDGQSFAAIADNWIACNLGGVDGASVHASSVRAQCPGAAGATGTAGATATQAHVERVDGQAVHPTRNAAGAASNAAHDAGASPPARDGLLAKTFGNGFGTLARQHLLLVGAAVLLGCLAGIPLGILAALAPRLRQPVLALAGMLQTVPSLALLAILIPLLGRIGTVPALVALCAYALLPIVRNTCTGLLQVPAGLRTAALALGLTRFQALRTVELPLAGPVILAGVKTAAVMSVGTATIAAFIGAGGFGERITTGLALNDNDMLLAGAIPAALLALLTQAGFETIESLLARRRGR